MLVLKKLDRSINHNNYLLEVENFKYLLKFLSLKILKSIYKLTKNGNKLESQISNVFQVLTGGTLLL
jgi:hypothetical protein